jgi:hypothetical protein
MNPELITEMLSIMERNRKMINEEIATLVYYYNGGLDYNSAWMTTALQRKTMSKVVEKHFDAMSSKSAGKLI